MERRFIEESFPINGISHESSKEKSIRHGHISTLHAWWARRPLAASRSTIYGALRNFPKNTKKIESENEFIQKLCKWSNSNDLNIIENAKSKINENFKEPPKILDPFGGGGSIPLESVRLGAETYCGDYNPVSVLVQKCTVEFPQLYGVENSKNNELKNKSNFQLLEDVKKWSKWIETESKKEIGRFYDYENTTTVGYIWAKTIPCQNPKCGAEIPLMRQYWLIQTKKKQVALFPFVKNGKIEFKIVGDGYESFPKDFNPKKGSISRAICTCYVCNSNVNAEQTRKLFQSGKSSEKLIVIITSTKRSAGKKFNLPSKKDIILHQNASKYLKEKIKHDENKSEISLIPDELITRVPLSFGVINVWVYGIKSWGELFNDRQKLMLITFISNLKKAYYSMLKNNYDVEYAKVITTYLALNIDRLVAYGSKMGFWDSTREKISQAMTRQALGMIFDYTENNPFSISFSWNTNMIWILRVLEHCLKIKQVENLPKTIVSNFSATQLPYSNNFFDAIITDPPYYDNVPYSYLSDFFYVWLKRSVGFLYPELFSTPLSPKAEEVVAYQQKDNTSGKEYFEDLLSKSFTEIYRVLKPEGIAIIVYAHKSTDGWEALIKSLVNSGLIVTAAWPIHTEMKGRLTSQNSAALASSIYMVCRKWEKVSIGFYRDIKKELKTYLDKKLEQLWGQGIAGGDFFISAIGSAVEVYGKYEKVVDDKDKEISVLKLLNDTRTIVTDYAINKVIKGEFSDKISQMTRFYILWRWAYGEAKVDFGNALKMAQSVGIDLEHEWNKGFIVKEKELIQVIGPDKRNEKELKESHDLIDVLHQTLLLWKKGKKESVDTFLEEKGYKNSQVFKRVAQAISESLPLESTEKKWLDGFLTGFKLDGSQGRSQSKLILDGEK
jgi:putative DNA methylase